MRTPPAKTLWTEGTPLRVAFVTVGDTNRKTGGYLYNTRLISGLRDRGLEVEEVVVSGASPEAQRAAVPLLGSNFDPSGYDAIVVDALARIAVSPHLDPWRALRPVVALIHELPSVAEGRPARERGCEEPLLRADWLVAVSSHGREVLVDRGVEAGRIRVVEPGFDGVPRGRRPYPEGNLVRVLCVAQWIPRKGILTLVEAWKLQERTGAVLQLIGETGVDLEYKTHVMAAIEAATRNSIVVSGCVDDATLGKAYASADVFVLASHYEGYGIVYAEALASGLPVIACDAGSIPEVVGREAAILIKPDDTAALSAALDLLLGDAALRARMSRAAHRRIARLPRWEDTVKGFEAVLKTLAIARRTGHK